jgi:hypothetical protein
MIIALIGPFFRAKTPEEVKEILKSEGKIPVTVYRGLFRKGIVNNLPTKVQSLMYPAKETKDLSKANTHKSLDYQERSNLDTQSSMHKSTEDEKYFGVKDLHP